MRKKTEGAISEVQDGFRRDREFVDQIFIVRQLCDKG